LFATKARDPSNSTAAGAAASVERTVAVLPFALDTHAPDDDAFALGLTAAVIDELERLSCTRRDSYIIPAAETIDTGVDTAPLAQQTLGAQVIVSGRLVSPANPMDMRLGVTEKVRDLFELKDGRQVVVGPADRRIVDRVARTVGELLGIHAQATR